MQLRACLSNAFPHFAVNYKFIKSLMKSDIRYGNSYEEEAKGKGKFLGGNTPATC
jgi:hypothetical protein